LAEGGVVLEAGRAIEGESQDGGCVGPPGVEADR